MKTSMLKLGIAASVAIGGCAVMAQEFGEGSPAAETATPPVSPETVAVPQMFEQKPDGALAADQQMTEEAPAKGPKSASDMITMHIEDKGYQVGAYDEENYSKMSAERVQTLPGNPIEKQLEEENEKVEKPLKASRKQLEKLGANLDEAIANKDGMTTSEWMSSISAWFMNSDKENVAAKYDADKAEAR